MFVLVFVMLVLLSLPAQAVIMPRADFQAGNWLLGIGMTDLGGPFLSVDYGLQEKVSLGMTFNRFWTVRSVYRWARPYGVDTGLVAGAGAMPSGVLDAPLSSGSVWGLHGGITLAFPLQALSLPIRLRLSLLGVYSLDPASSRLGFVASPGLAWRFHPHHELVFGEGTGIGWRGTF